MSQFFNPGPPGYCWLTGYLFRDRVHRQSENKVREIREADRTERLLRRQFAKEKGIRYDAYGLWDDRTERQFKQWKKKKDADK